MNDERNFLGCGKEHAHVLSQTSVFFSSIFVSHVQLRGGARAPMSGEQRRGREGPEMWEGRIGRWVCHAVC